MELMRTVTTDSTGVGFNRAELETQTCKYVAVSLVHGLVSGFQRLKTGMERIGIFHHELACAHHAETRADLIAEFGLDLVEIQRQLFIAANFFTRDIGNDFFMRRTKTELAFVPVLNLQHLWAEYRPATSFFPQLFRLYSRHQQLQRTGFVHLVTDDG